MKTVGIIGGFGPETTAEFQLEIIDLCRVCGMKERPEILMWNAPIPVSIEENLIMRDIGIESFLLFLIQGAKTLERAGASFLVMPCNTLHIFIDDIRKAVDIPVMSIVDVTVEHLQTCSVTHLAVIGTKATQDSGLFTTKLARAGIIPIIPTTHEQTAIDQIIFDTLNEKARRRSGRILKAITDECISRGALDILLACTDLQLVFPVIKEARVHDTMHIFADACVREIMR